MHLNSDKDEGKTIAAVQIRNFYAMMEEKRNENPTLPIFLKKIGDSHYIQCNETARLLGAAPSDEISNLGMLRQGKVILIDVGFYRQCSDSIYKEINFFIQTYIKQFTERISITERFISFDKIIDAVDNIIIERAGLDLLYIDLSPVTNEMAKSFVMVSGIFYQ
ncbi:MAG: hypothetical protein EZS28_021815 [Streblomastix strix]|uniref:Uncharacterized protein n=1 Tax=Streblomastix strix TaxID=222440 RepID=A0A5J4VJZ3_9EUKA|nr:MAG: hypothetical protein EZS28_021815 [Streblomastix strix]